MLCPGTTQSMSHVGYIINTYKYMQIHVFPRTNVCVWIPYIKYTPIHFLIRVSLGIGGGGYSHRGGTPVAPCIDTGLTRSKAASGEGTQIGHVSLPVPGARSFAQYSKAVSIHAAVSTFFNTERYEPIHDQSESPPQRLLWTW